MIINAKFTGQNGSCGFITGKTYLLRMYHTKPFLFHSDIFITPVKRHENLYFDLDSDFYIPYSTMETFLQNWDNVQVIEK